MSGTVVLTGATGFVGSELLVRLLERTDRGVVALVRARDDVAAAVRVDNLLGEALGPAVRGARPRVRALAADLERPGLGLAPGAFDALAAEAALVVHCAASISFSLPLEEARRINVGGTSGVLELARAADARGALERLVHVSTAYVAGERVGRVRADERDVGQRHRNTYERTKLEAEQLVARSGLPASVLRPSIVVGDSRTGWTPAFNVIYWPLRRGGGRPPPLQLPLRPAAPLPRGAPEAGARRSGRAGGHRPRRRRGRRAPRTGPGPGPLGLLPHRRRRRRAHVRRAGHHGRG